MLGALDLRSLEELVDRTVPKGIRLKQPLRLPPGRSETELLQELGEIASRNRLHKSFIGMGYSDCTTPPVILRNILQNPGWYTAYTPYQAEVAQGRLEALLNFQTMLIDLTGLEMANASLLDEGTAAAEAMAMMHAVKGKDLSKTFFVSAECHPQTIEVVKTRAQPLGIEAAIADHRSLDFGANVFGALLQYPASDGAVLDYRPTCERIHGSGGLVAVAADLMSLLLLVPPGEFGADIAVGNTQRVRAPLGYAGARRPHF